MPEIADPVPYFKTVTDLTAVPEVTKAEIFARSFLALKKGLPEGFQCTLCTNPIVKGAQAVYVGLVGKYYDHHAFVYIVHAECAATHIEIVRTVENQDLT